MALKRKFFKVRIGILNSDIEALGFSINDLNGKIVKYDLTRILRGKNLEATLVINVDGENALAVVKGLSLLPSYITRVMKKNISYVEDSFVCKTKDGNVRIKPFLLTRKKVHRSVRKALRNKTKEFIEKYAAEKKSEELFSEIISAKLQKELSLKLKKIYPLSLCEIRKVKLEAKK